MRGNEEALVGFLYDLMRDHIAPGKVEALIRDAEAHPGPFTFTNEHLAGYARELARRLLRVSLAGEQNA